MMLTASTFCAEALGCIPQNVCNVREGELLAEYIVKDVVDMSEEPGSVCPRIIWQLAQREYVICLEECVTVRR
jgi:hypothetical protein